MAVDTQEKRMNAASVGRPFLRARLPVGASDEQSRIASGLGYGGNALSLAAMVVVAQCGQTSDATITASTTAVLITASGYYAVITDSGNDSC